MVALRDARVRAEQRASRAITDVRLEREHAFTANQRQDLIEKLEQIEIVRLAWRMVLKRLLQRSEHPRHHLAGRGDDHRANRGAADDDELGGLKEDGERAAAHGETAEHGTEHHDQTDESRHGVQTGRE